MSTVEEQVDARERDVEIRELTTPPRTADVEFAWSLFSRWCEASGVSPTTCIGSVGSRFGCVTAAPVETAMCRFIYAMHADPAEPVGAAYLRKLAAGITTVHRLEGRVGPDQYLPAVEALLDAIQASDRGQSPAPLDAPRRPDAIPPPLLRAMVDHLERPANATAVRLRGIIALSEALGENPTDQTASKKRMSWWPRDHVEFADGCARIYDRASGEVTLLDRERHPVFYDALREAFDTEEPYPLRGPCRADLRAAWARFDPSVRRDGPDPRPHADDVDAAWARSDVSDRALWLACADVTHHRRVRDKAYLLVGVFSGHRNAEFRRLTLGDLERCEVGNGGWMWTTDADKGNKIARKLGGRVVALTKLALHTAADTAECSKMCAACALDAYVRLRLRGGATPASPLFVDLLTHSHPLATIGATRMLQYLADAVSEEAIALLGRPLRLSSRSTRITLATNARLAGATLSEIAQALSHRQTATTLRYIQVHDPSVNEEFVLTFAAVDEAEAGRVDT